MTSVYFVRHAQSDNSIHEDAIRPLSQKGLGDRTLVTGFLRDKEIDVVLASPYKRAVDTVQDFADSVGLPVRTIDDFRERRIGEAWIEDFLTFSKNQWADFTFKLPHGESLEEVQERNISALNEVLAEYKEQNIVIGTHGTALSTIINYYDKTYEYEDFMAMVYIMPWVVRMDFIGDACMGMEKIDLFQPDKKPDYERCVVRTSELGTLKAYRYTVIFARYKDKWLYCRAKSRNTYETPGGHIEQDETPLEAAKRELYEETGAIDFDIEPAFDYLVHVSTVYSNGQAYYAQIRTLGEMPDFEMSEIKLFDTIPDQMRLPQILPALFEKMQSWLDTRSAKDEQ